MRSSKGIVVSKWPQVHSDMIELSEDLEVVSSLTHIHNATVLEAPNWDRCLVVRFKQLGRSRGDFFWSANEGSSSNACFGKAAQLGVAARKRRKLDDETLITSYMICSTRMQISENAKN